MDEVKGSMEGMLPMIGLLILAALLTMQSLPISQGLGMIMGESAQDIENLVETRSTGEHVASTYTEYSMEYSANNAAFELSDGGIDDWNLAEESNNRTILLEIMDNWEEETANNLEERYGESSCRVNLNNDELTLFPGHTAEDLFENSYEKTESLFEAESFSISCSSGTEYTEENYQMEREFENQFVELAKASALFIDNLESNWNQDIEESYEGDTIEACTRDNAENQAEEDAEGEYLDKFEDLEEFEPSTPNDIEKSSSVNHVGDFETDSKETEEECGECEERYDCENLETDEEDDGIFCSDIDGCQIEDEKCVESNGEDHVECKSREDNIYEANSTYYPESSEFEWEVEDNKEVPVKGHLESLYMEITDLEIKY